MSIFKLVEFTTDTKTYNKAGALIKEPNALGYHFINTGGCIVYINNLPIYPSGVLDTMYSGYSDKSTYNIRFDATSLINPELTVITYNKTN